MITVIIFGTFDLLHIGHINIINRCISYGNRLVVGVSSDELNYRKKQKYPVYSESDRMSIIKCLKGVDEVFKEESLEKKREYILKYKADVLIMGHDWKGKFDEFSDICRIVYLPRTKNISTSEVKDKICKNVSTNK